MGEQAQALLAKASANGMSTIQPGQKVGAEQLKAMQHAQQSDPREMTQGMRQGMDAIKEMRAEADVPKRLEIAESCKTDANSQLAASPAKALKSYLVAIWVLMRGDPEPTRSLVAPVAIERDAKISLGAGSEEMTDADCFGESFVSQIGELRTALHLNVAAAALKLNMFALANGACHVVLQCQPENPKALFRLAKASEGLGDLSGAIATVNKLLRVEGQSDNNEARKLLQALRARKSKEAKIYSGFFEKAREDGGALYDGAEADPDKAKVADLKKNAADQDSKMADEIINSRMHRLSNSEQAELKKMRQVGIAPTEIVAAYRRFLKEAMKKLAREVVPEEERKNLETLPEDVLALMSATQANQLSDMEDVMDKVKRKVETRKQAERQAAQEKLEKDEALRKEREEVAARAAEEAAAAKSKVAEEVAAKRIAEEADASTKYAAEVRQVVTEKKAKEAGAVGCFAWCR